MESYHLEMGALHESVTQGTPADAEAAMGVVTACMEDMVARGIDQWDKVYPSRAVIDEDAASGGLFVYRDGESVAGIIVLNEEQNPEYAVVAWTIPDPRPLVIHRLCVHPHAQNKGVARALMDFAEEFATARGYRSIRLDTYTGNPRALGLYEKRGYTIAGHVRFPRRSKLFVCLERAV